MNCTVFELGDSVLEITFHEQRKQHVRKYDSGKKNNKQSKNAFFRNWLNFPVFVLILLI